MEKCIVVPVQIPADVDLVMSMVLKNFQELQP